MIRKRISVIMATIIITTTTMPINSAFAETNTSKILPYIEADGQYCVNINELAKDMGATIKELDGGIEVYLNYKKVDIYADDGYIYVNGSSVPLKTAMITDQTTGEKHEWPIYKEPEQTDDGDFLIPKEVITKYIGFELDDDGVYVDKLLSNLPSASQSENIQTIVSDDPQNGWKINDGVCSYLVQGQKCIGWTKLDGEWFYFDANGAMKTGWIQDGGKRYYIYMNGKMAHDTAIDGYYLGSDGAVRDTTENGYTPYYDYDLMDYEDEYIDNHNISRFTYNEGYANMLKQQMEAERAENINQGWHTKDGKYYFLKDGIPIKGWFQDGSLWYYFNQDGSMKTGWFNDNGEWYYFYESGTMAEKVVVDGYYLTESGKMSRSIPDNAPTGISYKELVNRVRSEGYSHKKRIEADDQYNTLNKSGYEFQWYSKSAAESISYISIWDDYSAHILARCESDMPEYNRNVYNVLELLIPTKVREVYTKINENPVSQTIYADGRKIDVSIANDAISFDISDQ